MQPAKSLAEVTTQDSVLWLLRFKRRAASRKTYAVALRSLFRWMHERGHIAEDPTVTIDVRVPGA
jgi:site-specific recombinase XerD